MGFGRKKENMNYFDEFIKNSELAVEIVKTLRDIIDKFDVTKMQERAIKLHEIENQADENLHNLKDYLLKDFLPPIDREDVLSIAHQIDNIIDGIDEIIINMSIYNITSIRPEMKELLDLLVGTVTKTHSLFFLFSISSSESSSLKPVYKSLIC